MSILEPSYQSNSNLRPYSAPEHQPFEFAGDKGNALLIHGFPGTPAEMRPLGMALAKQGWQSQGILLPGFGPNIAQMNLFNKDHWLAHAEAKYRQSCDSHQPCAIIGYSMGGTLALCLAQRLRPDHLVLIAPFWNLPGFASRMIPWARWVIPQLQPFKNADFGDPDLRRQIHRVLPEADLDNPNVQQTIREEFVLPLNTIHEILRLGKLAYRQANTIHSSTLIIQGKEDPLVSPGQTRRLWHQMPTDRTTYIEVEGKHDIVNQSNSGRETIDLVTQFLQGSSSATLD